MSMYLYLQILSLMLICSRTSFKIELLTNVEVLHYTEAKDFFHRITHLKGMYSFLCSMAPHWIRLVYFSSGGVKSVSKRRHCESDEIRTDQNFALFCRNYTWLLKMTRVGYNFYHSFLLLNSFNKIILTNLI